jgi:hypothetical protein
MTTMDQYFKEHPNFEELNIRNTLMLGQFKHVIRLCYPCGMFEDVRGEHGEPPTIERFAKAFTRHHKECDDGCHI